MNDVPQTADAAEIMRSALLDIRNSHTPEQPASSNCDEVSWVMQHVGALRRLAANALDRAASVAQGKSEDV